MTALGRRELKNI